MMYNVVAMLLNMNIIKINNKTQVMCPGLLPLQQGWEATARFVVFLVSGAPWWLLNTLGLI